jgi:hypothetical protein
MPYKLKLKELAFQVIREGKFEYRRYVHGIVYDEIPPEDANRFDKIEPEKAETKKSEGRMQNAESSKKEK